jgi:lipopolysaccharide heptosyltransferase I
VPAAARDNSSLSTRCFERILLIKPSSLGDVVHALPVLHGLRARYPDARIEWLIGAAFAQLVEGHPDVDELVLFDRRRFARVGRSFRVTADFVRYLRQLRARDYDLVIDLQGLFRTGLFSYLTKAAVRIGPGDAREGACMFYTHRLGPFQPNEHAVDRNYAVAALLGFANVPVRFDLALPAEAVRSAQADLRGAGWLDRRPLLAVLPGTRWDTKRWPAERFAAVIDNLHDGSDAQCVLLGSPDEAELCERIAGQCRTEPMNLAGRTTLRGLAATIQLAEVVLAHDSAPMHLAVALERPLVCLMGPTNAHRTGPYRRFGDVVRLDLECAPCYLRKLTQCRFQHRCMQELPVATVLNAVARARSGGSVSVS